MLLQLSIDDEVVAPYTPVTHATTGAGASESLHIALLNRRVTVGPDGLPSAVQVIRPPSAHGVIATRTIELLAKPVSLVFIQAGAPLPMKVTTPSHVTKSSAATVGWSAEFVCGPARVVLNGSLHMDGYLDFVFELSDASIPTDDENDDGASFLLDDIQLEIEWLPQPDEKSGMMLMGMGVVSGPVEKNTSVAWHWSTYTKNNFMWAGTASAGMKLQLKDDNDLHRDAAIKSYSVLPLTWDNKGRGGTNITAVAASAGASALGTKAVAFTGPYTLPPKVEPPLSNGSRVFRFDLSVTPFRARNESQHWGLRHFQVGYPAATFTSAAAVAKTGATVVNIHQGKALPPS